MSTLTSTSAAADPALRPGAKLLEQLLESGRERVVDRALQATLALRHSHYEAAGRIETRSRLERLYDAAAIAATQRKLGPVVEYAQRLAEERYATGHTLPELQAAFNALEEALWEELVADLPPEGVAGALSLVSSIFGVAKDTLACAYVAEATRTRRPAFALSALSAG